MAAEHLELLAVFKAHDVIGLHGGADRDGGLLFDFGGLGHAKTGEGFMDGPNDEGNVGYRDAVVADMSSHDIGGQRYERFGIVHAFTLRMPSYLTLPIAGIPPGTKGK
ncbi:hypothetical protein SPYCW_2385 [Sphingopyxis sp. EG6]|nr:hypothetical protein SPYCW_2385 [Sphingopyxis sp. EG6]